ncbi:heme biosynthesis protein HemY [Noviherbaspirillum galbum]|uniref:Heme biosynthesis protein HemY n=1 Tax=Noviherbaspirillum galbum TaxID=2709383 RepID=A0A6B3ST15_9BURK|nr:heme biosynthesis protein HemY [Noviherbaspirillum galbum]NEX61552.1 heme biosynthesis protein HemY [Noviherbaspirillum galbum]
MRVFLTLVIVFAAAIGLAVGARFNPGNVVLFYPPYRIDLSLNLFLLLLLVLFAVMFALLNTVRSAQQMPQRVAAYRRERREREGNRALREALKSLFEGRFGQAEKAAGRASELPENVGLAALIGARAAHRMGQPARRDVWLAKAQEEPPLRTARLMTAIELAVDGHQPESALDALRELNASGIRHIHALRLALKANQRAKDWPEVLRLVRLLDKRNALHPALSRRLRELAYDDLLASQTHDAESIRRVWAAVPAEERVQPFVASRAARAFSSSGLVDESRAIVEKALATEWDERLVRAYRNSAAAEGSAALLAQIERCEEWLQARPGDAELELTLGTLCLRQKLWGKAQRHLEQALLDADDTQTVREAHLKLAQLHEALNQPEQASSHYRMSALAELL